MRFDTPSWNVSDVCMENLCLRIVRLVCPQRHIADIIVVQGRIDHSVSCTLVDLELSMRVQAFLGSGFLVGELLVLAVPGESGGYAYLMRKHFPVIGRSACPLWCSQEPCICVRRHIAQEPCMFCVCMLCILLLRLNCCIFQPYKWQGYVDKHFN